MTSPLAAGQRAVSLGASAFKNLRSFVGRGAKISAPVTAFFGAIADLASTIAKFSLYLLMFSLSAALVSGLVWFLRYRGQFARAAADGVFQPDEVAELRERNVWSVTFAFFVVASIVMGGFVLADAFAGNGNKGVIASVVPGMDKVQDALFRVEKKLDAVKEDTSAVRRDTAKLVTSVDEIARRFDSLATTGGLIPGAKTPEEHYHNARIQELNGNFGAARKEYSEFLQSNLDVLDPWLSYSAMLKVQEGRAGAIEALRYFGEKAGARTTSYETALALLDEREQRISKLAALSNAHPEYGPIPYLLSQEYSEAKTGEQTMADMRSEKEWLAKFRSAHTEGRFVRYFLDKKEAQKWIDVGEARWAKLESTPANVLETPVTLTATQSNAGWAVELGLSDFRAKEIFYKLDGVGDFTSTGVQAYRNPQTGERMVNLHVPLPNLSPGEHVLEVKYLDKNNQTNGPYKLRFSTGDEQMGQGKMMLNVATGAWLSFRDFNGKVLLYFTTLMSYRPIIQEVRYSLNSEALDQTFKFKPSDKMYEVGDELYLSVPKTTQFANVQVTFKDGTKSTVQKVMRVTNER